MGFEKKHYRDGDVVFDIPSWRKEWESLNQKTAALPLAAKREERKRIKPEEVGLRHLESGAHVRLADDGSIALFSGKSGIRIDEKGIAFFGENIRVLSGTFDQMTNANGAKVNGVPTQTTYSLKEEKGKSKEALDLCESIGVRVRKKEDES